MLFINWEHRIIIADVRYSKAVWKFPKDLEQWYQSSLLHLRLQSVVWIRRHTKHRSQGQLPDSDQKAIFSWSVSWRCIVLDGIGAIHHGLGSGWRDGLVDRDGRLPRKMRFGNKSHSEHHQESPERAVSSIESGPHQRSCPQSYH